MSYIQRLNLCVRRRQPHFLNLVRQAVIVWMDGVGCTPSSRHRIERSTTRRHKLFRGSERLV